MNMIVSDLNESQRAKHGSTMLRYAVLAALAGVTSVTHADDSKSGNLEEITVTASRRSQTVEEVPYAISVVGADQLARTGTTDLASLSRQVPGLNLADFGARFSAATAPIMRGINAGDVVTSPQNLSQAPVGTYINNSPVAGYFQFDDVQRIEVLQGPQGTLYGAGALGGALRIIPNAPELGQTSGRFGGSGSTTAESSTVGYNYFGTINLPVGDTVAIRASAKYAYDPGFIKAYGILQRTGSQLDGLPVAANPSDPLHSSAVYESQSDWNYQKTLTTRVSLKWKLSDVFDADLAYLYTNVSGNSGPVANSDVKAGPYALDPRITLPAGGPYTTFSGIKEPYARDVGLGSLDLTYDAGFATLSSTSSYYSNHGKAFLDYTYVIFNFQPFTPYYTGNPVNPRFVGVQAFDDRDKTFTQEIRLVSKPGADKPIDYVAGVFFEKQDRVSYWGLGEPGTRAYTIALGCTSPLLLDFTKTPPTPTPFPACQTQQTTNDIGYDQTVTSSFKDKSIFGEVTWHLSSKGQITFGGRYLKQDFVNGQTYDPYAIGLVLPAVPTENSTSKAIWKINPSYEFADKQLVFATWSQGYRRGGINSFPTSGIFQESPLIHVYQPDKTDNFEVGIKGRVGQTTYSVSAFNIYWDKPQITTVTPVTLEYVVVNANKARSSGVSIESSGPLGLPHVSYALGYTYANARLTSNFSLPANNGLLDAGGNGILQPGLIAGSSGTQLPGSPKNSAGATINYDPQFIEGYDTSFSINASYTGEIRNGLPNIRNPYTPNPSYTIGNLSGSLRHERYNALLFVNNFTNKRAIIAAPPIINAPTVGPLVNGFTINRPRTIGLQLFYTF